MADTPSGETATPQVLENNTNPSATPVVNAGDIEAARKEAEQAKMRANQLENELQKIREAQEADKLQKLKENEEFKTLYEQQVAENERIRNEKIQSEKESQLKAERDALLNTYPDAVKAIAEEAGMSLVDVTDEAKAELKAKLDKISERVGGEGKVTPNNTRTVNNDKSREELLKEYRETGNRQAINAAINGLSFVKPFTEQK